MKTLRKILDNTKNISSILVGVVFVFSGFVKGIDLLGSTYKFTDYFVAFGFPSLEKISLPLAFLLSASEFIIGTALIFRFRMLFFSWLSLVFMSFFTALTLFIAIANPVSDCGCFGDALVISNWATFLKNIILILLVLNVFIFRNKFRKFFPEAGLEWGLAAVMLFIFTMVSFYSFNHLPVFDFRPYYVGSNIREKMNVPIDAPLDEYKVVLFYEKEGKINEFSLDNLPDSTWKWVETKSTLVKKGYDPPIKNFSIERLSDREDVTDFILSDVGLTFLLIAHDLNKSNTKNQEIINKLAEYARFHNHQFYSLTASSQPTINDFIEKHKVTYEFFNTDDITLKTIIRSNPGLVLLKEGTVIAKWHNNDIPEPSEIGENLLAYVTDRQREAHEKTRKSLFIFSFLFVLVMVWNIRKSFK